MADSGDMDVDMEGPTGSMSSAHASQANSVNTHQSDEVKDVPKWKRRVKLPSHSKLILKQVVANSCSTAL